MCLFIYLFIYLLCIEQSRQMRDMTLQYLVSYLLFSDPHGVQRGHAGSLVVYVRQAVELWRHDIAQSRINGVHKQTERETDRQTDRDICLFTRQVEHGNLNCVPGEHTPARRHQSNHF